MFDDDTDITSAQIKKNVAFETVKGIFTSYGIMIAGLTVSAFVTERFKKINPPPFTYLRGDNGKGRIDNATNFLRNITVMFAPIALFCGFVSNASAKKHNEKVDALIQQQTDSFANRIEQEKIEPSEIPAGR